MKPGASVLAILAIGPLSALIAACGYCHGHENVAICIIACLGVLAAAGILTFVGLVAFGWLVALAFSASRKLAPAHR